MSTTSEGLAMPQDGQGVFVVEDSVRNKTLTDILLLLLEAKTARRPEHVMYIQDKGVGGKQNAPGRACQIYVGGRGDYEGPKNADIAFGERIFTANPSLLLNPALDVIGEGYECAIEGDGFVNWLRFRRLNKAPSHRWAFGKVARWYDVESAHISADGQVSRALVTTNAYDKDGFELPSMEKGFNRPQINGHKLGMVVSASIREDMCRANTVRVALEDHVTANLVVPMGAHLDILDNREGFMVKNRRRALVHRVCKHSRELFSGRVTEVREYLRGARTAMVDGVLVTLTPQ